MVNRKILPVTAAVFAVVAVVWVAKRQQQLPANISERVDEFLNDPMAGVQRVRPKRRSSPQDDEVVQDNPS